MFQRRRCGINTLLDHPDDAAPARLPEAAGSTVREITQG
jgi:hypothetical protein